MAAEHIQLKLTQIGGSCFVWNAKDARTLREDHRIIGTLIGCLARAPRQNTHLGLPLQLMPEEVALLLDLGVATVIKEVYREPVDEDVVRYKQLQDDAYKQQVQLFQEERRKEIRQKLPDIIEGKKKKRKKLLYERRERGEPIDDEEFDKDIEIDPDTVEIPAIGEELRLVQIHTLCAHRQKMSITVNWNLPDTAQGNVRYRVFKDLWERGYFLTSGSKFGGDFLVYPGDPARFHSLFVIICQPHDARITALDVVSMARLGTSVKKTAVLCSLDENEHLCYTSLQWTGIT